METIPRLIKNDFQYPGLSRYYQHSDVIVAKDITLPTETAAARDQSAHNPDCELIMVGFTSDYSDGIDQDYYHSKIKRSTEVTLNIEMAFILNIICQHLTNPDPPRFSD
jgi:hypothetical protein